MSDIHPLPADTPGIDSVLENFDFPDSPDSYVTVEPTGVWTVEVEEVQDYGGADTFYHIVVDDRHVCEVDNLVDAELIVNAVNTYHTVNNQTTKN